MHRQMNRHKAAHKRFRAMWAEIRRKGGLTRSAMVFYLKVQEAVIEINMFLSGDSTVEKITMN